VQVVDRVPVTRIYDASTVDYLGLPVWGAVTPLARDLKVHAGKGATAQAARISAVMEAIERTCAEEVDDFRVRAATYRHLRRVQPDRVIDPCAYDLPFDTAYRPDRSIAWIEGYDVLSGREVWVPLDVVISPGAQGVCAGVDTNGLASGNTYTEAVLHALYEIIERDADAHDQFVRRYGDDDIQPSIRLIEPTTLESPAADWIDRLRAVGLTVTIRDLSHSHDLGVPAYRATVADWSFPGSEGRTERFTGLGCDLDAGNAVFRAVSEAVQSHTSRLLGARDTFEQHGRAGRLDGSGLVSLLTARSSVHPFASTATDALSDDLYDRLLVLVKRLEQAGLRSCVVVDLTREDLAIPVVRVLVPGAAAPFGNTSKRPSLRLLRSLV
jgi:YcaO-like protein with predicted kinase domain